MRFDDVKEEEERENRETSNVGDDVMEVDVKEHSVVAQYDVYYTPRGPYTRVSQRNLVISNFIT